MENGFKCWQRTCLLGLQTEPENTIPKTNYDARYVNPIFKTTTQRKGLVKKKFKSQQTAKSNTMSDQQNQYNCSSTENFRFIKESFEAALISARLKSDLSFLSFTDIRRTKKNEKTVSKAVQSLEKSVFSLRSKEERLSDKQPALCPPPCPQNYSTRKSRINYRLTRCIMPRGNKCYANC